MCSIDIETVECDTPAEHGGLSVGSGVESLVLCGLLASYEARHWHH